MRLRPLAPGDLVLRKVVGTAKPCLGKVGAQLGGAVQDIFSIEAYYLEDLDESVIRHPWNVNNLRRYYY